MAERLALLGAAKGPWCSINLVKRPALRISGSENALITVTLMYKEGGMNYPLEGDGLHPLPGDNPIWIQLECARPNPKLVCTVIPTKVTNAILST